jgi:ADP-ribosylation factor related protein 1
MYTLLSGLWEHCFRKSSYRVLILGLDNAGKTTVLEQLRSSFQGTPGPREMKIPPTVGLNLANISIGSADVTFWDLGGQEGLRVLWDKYYGEAHAILFVVDSSDAEHLGEALRELRGVLGDSSLADAPVLIFMNKKDLSGASSLPRESLKALQDIGGNKAILVRDVSALDGEGVLDGLKALLKIVPTCPRTRALAFQESRR